MLSNVTALYHCLSPLQCPVNQGSSLPPTAHRATLPLQYCTALHCTALHYTTLHCTALHCTACHCTALHYTALHCTALHCTALHCTALHCTALHCTALHCTALHCTALHCTSVHCSLHCTTLHFTGRLHSTALTFIVLQNVTSQSCHWKLLLKAGLKQSKIQYTKGSNKDKFCRHKAV